MFAIGIKIWFDSSHEAYALFLTNQTEDGKLTNDPDNSIDVARKGSTVSVASAPSWKDSDMLNALRGYETIRRDISRLSDFEEDGEQ